MTSNTNLEAGGARVPILSRLLNGRTATLFVRNTIVSCFAFAIDLAILWAFVELMAMPKLIAVTIAFLIANTIHYAFCRIWIFEGTHRALASGYVYFLINAGVGLGLTVGLFAAFVALGMHYIIARIVASVFAGLAVFLLNAMLNFKSV